MWQWIFQILVAIDQLLNAILGGKADETLSARAHRMRVKRHRYFYWLADVIDAIFFWDEDHCANAYDAEVKKRQFPDHYS